MDAHDNLEEFTDPPNYDIEEGERSVPRIAFYCDLAKAIADRSWRSPAARGW